MNSRASEADRLLNSDLFKDVIATVEQNIKDQWAAEPSKEGREALHATLRAVPLVVQELRKIRDSGKIEDHNMRRA